MRHDLVCWLGTTTAVILLQAAGHEAWHRSVSTPAVMPMLTGAIDGSHSLGSWSWNEMSALKSCLTLRFMISPIRPPWALPSRNQGVSPQGSVENLTSKSGFDSNHFAIWRAWTP